MQRFQFRLDRVLQFRRKQRDIEEGVFAACLATVQATERKQEQLRTERAAIDRELLGRTAIPAAEIQHLGYYRVRASKEASGLAQEHRQNSQAVADQRVRVQKTQQRVKLLEKMRDRKLVEHTAAEAKELDEAAAEAFLVRWSQTDS